MQYSKLQRLIADLGFRSKNTLHDIPIFFLVNLTHSGGRSRTDHATDVTAALLIVVQLTCCSHHSRCHIRVSSHVLWFLLRPNKFSIRIFLAVLGCFIKWEWSNLLQGANSDISATAFLAFCKQLIINLTCAKHQCLHIIRVIANCFIPLIVSTLEAGSSTHVLQTRHASFKAQQVLWRYHNQRLTKVTVNLPPQAMEIVGRSRAVNDLPVGFLNLGACIATHGRNVVWILFYHLEVAFEAARRVLGSLAIISMRKQENQSTLTKPFVLSGCDKLIQHNLSSVDEVSKLCLPEDKGVGVLQRITVLKSKYSKFRQNGVTNSNLRLGIGA
mmetsp:Transcript_13005/g.26709  ORF Transcript_13005/g.26709 Transcript_13005/m.26709 type:complete len:329 (+) Transcript_13005:76-1062(+)